MKNKQKAVICLLIATVFLMPLIGNTVASEGRGTYTWYFDSYDPFEAWETNPQYMVDGSLLTFASTRTGGDVELCDDSSYEPTHPDYTIIKVELRAWGKYAGGQQGVIILRPVFRLGDGDNHSFYPPENNSGWSEWFDITNDTNAPDPWTWLDIANLDCKVIADIDPAGLVCTLYCGKVEIRVTYTE